MTCHLTSNVEVTSRGDGGRGEVKPKLWTILICSNTTVLLANRPSVHLIHHVTVLPIL